MKLCANKQRKIIVMITIIISTALLKVNRSRNTRGYEKVSTSPLFLMATGAQNHSGLVKWDNQYWIESRFETLKPFVLPCPILSLLREYFLKFSLYFFLYFASYLFPFISRSLLPDCLPMWQAEFHRQLVLNHQFTLKQCCSVMHPQELLLLLNGTS